jgi:hypothetical protein
VIAQAIAEDGKLSPLDIERVIRWKGESSTRAASRVLPARRQSLRARRLRAAEGVARRTPAPASRAEAKELNLDPPKGVLFAGVQGCGKSLAAKFIARSGSCRC